ncbi:MAG: molybdopterin-guanine dinucleotide biosynthesis protein A [Magnetovibrionaceae bacterium]
MTTARSARKIGAPLVGLLVVLSLVLIWLPASGQAQGVKDRHAGYYYPIPQSAERVKPRARQLAGMDRRRRIGFVTAIVNDMMKKPFPPTIAMFAKGTNAEKLIIISNREGRLNTIYRVRALLAMMTASARTTPIFHELQVEDQFTFLDLAKMLGFEMLTVSDGDRFAHQILID